MLTIGTLWMAACTGSVVTAQAPAPSSATSEPVIVSTPTQEAVQATLAPTSQPTVVPTDVPTPQPTIAPVGAPAADAPQESAMTDASQLTACDVTARPDPLPVPGSPGAQSFFQSFRVPLPSAPLYDPPGPKRVGLQAGHWLTDQVPAELGRLQGGAVGGGKQEWQVNLDVAQRAAALLEANGVQVDVLPATIPPHYQASAFLALHADGDTTGQTRGFKVARPGFSSLPEVDDRFVAAINQTYASETELPRDDEHISLRMRYYYAFNSRRYCHAVAPGVPQAIVEMAYLTNATDRQSLIGDPQRLAQALADSLQAFLATTP